MTLSQKIALCSGLDAWRTKAFKKCGIPSITFSDGPHGLRKQLKKNDMLGLNASVPATCFPTAATSACSWDKNLLEQEGSAIAKEAAANGVQVILGPGANIKRNPLCGRNFEYFSEDPLLSGELASSYIIGVQKNGVGASLKHFACNNQEYFRMVSDSILDERALREIYLRPFEIAVKKSRPLSVMCSYNKINGVYSSENEFLLKKILRGEWGFSGVVITDWGAVGERDKSFLATCDLAMPGGSAYGEKEVLKKIRKGEFSPKYVEESCERILNLIKIVGGGLCPPSESPVPQSGLMRQKSRHGCAMPESWRCPANAPGSMPDFCSNSANAPDSTKKNSASFQKAHHALAKKIAEESAVLLKNEGQLLPLSDFSKACFIGDMAKNPRYQGYGSSRINPTELHSACELFPNVPFAQGFDECGNTNESLLQQAAALAKKSKAAIIFAGLPPTYESESFDRSDMKMPQGQLDLIEKICRANENTIVVLHSGGVVECPWADRAKSILLMGLSGQAGAEAACDLLLGRKNPSGHLAETWPKKYEDCPSSKFYSRPHRNAEYRESIFCGYRYYDTAKKDVRFAFGHGLSYTNFLLSDLTLQNDELSLTVKNSGKKDGACVLQIYVEKVDSKIFRPKKELKAFEKIFLKAGEKKSVCIKLNCEFFLVWNEGAWKTENGKYKIFAGTNCENPELCAEVFRSGCEFNFSKKNLWYETLSGSPARSDLEALLGRKIEDFKIPLPHTITSALGDTKKTSAIMRFIFKIIDFVLARQNPRGSVEYKMAAATFNEVTLRAAQAAGGIRLGIAQMFAHFANGKFFRGIAALFR